MNVDLTPNEIGLLFNMANDKIADFERHIKEHDANPMLRMETAMRELQPDPAPRDVVHLTRACYTGDAIEEPHP